MNQYTATATSNKPPPPSPTVSPTMSPVLSSLVVGKITAGTVGVWRPPEGGLILKTMGAAAAACAGFAAMTAAMLLCKIAGVRLTELAFAVACAAAGTTAAKLMVCAARLSHVALLPVQEAPLIYFPFVKMPTAEA